METNIQEIVAKHQLPKPTIKDGQTDLDKDAFLKLLMTQMQQQDPLDPMDNKEMLSQMAQFTSLEQMTNLNQTFAKSNSIASFMSATNMLGKEVELPNPLDVTGKLGPISSKVVSIKYGKEGPVLTLDNGMFVNSDELLSVREPKVTEN
jgi:flagellar basal-body rod modification protein FlgD